MWPMIGIGVVWLLAGLALGLGLGYRARRTAYYQGFQDGREMRRVDPYGEYR